MLGWLRKEVPVVGSVYFRGTWPLRAEEFGFLAARGIQMRPTEGGANEEVIWSVDLAHPEWGEAKLACRRSMPLLPPALVDWDPGLTRGEAEAIKASGTCVQILANSRRGHLLKDRKNALMYLGAVMGADGVCAVDHVSQRTWSRAALEAETAHGADVDVESLFSLHVVQGEDGLWLHTHGLAQIGLFDFDILNPSESAYEPGSDLVRAVAFAVLEGNLKPGGEVELFSNSSPIRAVAVADFEAKASRGHLALRDDPDGSHRESRVVLCDSAGGLLGRLRSKPRPSAYLMRPLEDGTVIHYSSEASALMGERALSTYPLFRQMGERLKAYEPPMLAKLGYETDRDKGVREYLWFHVHEAGETELEATLLNQPHGIGRMKEGERGRHPITRLADWQIPSPLGAITPRQTLPWRALQEHLAGGVAGAATPAEEPGQPA